MNHPLTARLLVPIANEADAERTSDAIAEYFDGPEPERPTIHVVHVIEKAGGAPDKAPLEARRQQAREIFDIVDERVGGSGFAVEPHLAYGTDVVETIHETAAETDATAIAFLPREGGLFAQLVSGNLTKQLVTTARVPVLTLPLGADEAW